jgi:hypothetical protein
MTHFFWQLLVTAFLVFPPQQEATPVAPSLADAARASRERQKSSKPKHVLTDADVSHNSGSGIAESEVRPQLQKDATVSQVPTAADLTHRIYDFSVALGNSAAIESANYRRSILYGRENTPFPGQKEWEEQLDAAVQHFVDELGPAASGLRAILEENKDALSRGDPAVPQKVRKQWIEALIPFTTWQMRVHQLMLDGEARAKASRPNQQTH